MTNYSTVPGIVTGVMLTCEVMDLINQCTVDWDVSDQGRFKKESKHNY